MIANISRLFLFRDTEGVEFRSTTKVKKRFSLCIVLTYLYLCSMKIMTRRYVASAVLLAVFLPMLLLSSFHVHPEAHLEEDECQECVHHVPHAGHFTSGTTCGFDCVLCQFLTLPFLLAPVVVFKAKRFIHIAPLCCVEQGVALGVRGAVFGRAPPSLGRLKIENWKLGRVTLKKKINQ